MEPAADPFASDQWRAIRSAEALALLDGDPFRTFLRQAAWALQPSVIVELGTHKGEGAAALAGGAPEALVVTIDNDAAKIDRALVGDYPNIRCVNADVCDTHAVAIAGPVDLLFVDAAKTGAEVAAWLPHLAECAVVMVDDILTEPRGAWETLTKSPGWTCAELAGIHGQFGFGVAVRGKEC